MVHSLDKQTQHGLIYALGAFLLWGLAPVYFKAVMHVSPLEVLAHRVVWSVAFLGIIVATLKSQRRALVLLTKQQITYLLFSAIFVSINWLTFIWAVNHNRILETSLGYFINPLVSVMLGMVFLQEKLRRWQVIAIGLAACGVANQIVFVGHLPWVALVLAVSFGLYGLIRKKAQVDAIAGLTAETLLLLPFALVYIGWLYSMQNLMFSSTSIELDLLLICAGLMTSLPLLFFAAGNRRLSLTVVGLVQYITPTITFLLAIFLYAEPFQFQQLITFVFIWTGLVLFTAESMQQKRKSLKPEQEAIELNTQ